PAEEKPAAVEDALEAHEDVLARAKGEGISTAYELKCLVVNDVLQRQIGMGRYQWYLFVLSGWGWMADNIWLQGIAIILPEVQRELVPAGSTNLHVEFATLSLYVGLILGATTWGILSDVIGRRLSWNITLFIAGVFGIAAGASPTLVALCFLSGCIGFGVGGNLPVDGMLFLEFIPKSHQPLLTLLSAWWSLGQLLASLVAWPFIIRFSCDPTAVTCTREENPGWRYTFYTLGALTFVMFVFRYFVFDMQESPKYLIAKGRDEEAIAVLQHVARVNRVTLDLTVEDLQRAVRAELGDEPQLPAKSAWESVKEGMTTFDLGHVRPLFSTPRLAVNTSLVIFIWGCLGLAYPLYNGFVTLYLTNAGAAFGDTSLNTTYRNYAIFSILGIPGSLIACVLVEWKGKWAFGGRKFAMALSTVLSGLFLFLFTTAKTEPAILGWNCATSLTENAMYGVLYAYTPEVFPGPHRGTGDGLASCFNRICGLMAPIIKIYAGATNASAPIFVSASLFVVASIFMLLLPIETYGKAAM
ncbi:MFS general substrate transporter, partial [Dacryopinax primogenitus]